MSSSTSSFRAELKVVACVLAVLVGVEVLMRFGEDKLSVDIAHIRSGDDVAERIRSSPQRSLLLIGNSLTRDGIAPEVLVAGAGGELSVEAYHPDGSSVNEWAYAYRRFFVESGVTPDFLIVGAGRSHLFDSELPPDTFGAYYCSRRDIPRYFKRHVSDVDDVAGFFLSRYSVAYASRRRVQPRVFSALIPHYQEVLPRLQATPRVIGEQEERELGHRNLREFLDAARAAGTRVAVVAIPMPEPYPLPDSTRQAVAEGGAILVDGRGLAGIQPDNFPDRYHLDAAGAGIFTQYLVTKLRPLWWPESNDGD